VSALIILIISIIVLLCGYFLYCRYLEKVWKIDADHPTPAHTLNDNVDYVPSRKEIVFGHHFASVAGASPINGPILAAGFGWAPILLWILLGSVFVGAAHDFAALYASVKNQGKSIGYIIEIYIGKTGKYLFLIFVWMLSVLVIAAFADIVAVTFNGIGSDGALNAANASAAVTSVLFILISVVFGICVNKLKTDFMWSSVIGIIALVLCMIAGLLFPLYYSKFVWLCIIFVYIMIASVVPVWLILQPRDYLNSFLLYGLIIFAVVGAFCANPQINLPAFTGFIADGKFLFPFLFITIACGAVSGFHSLIASGTTSKQISSEKDIKFVACGSMLVEAFLSVLALICVGALFAGGKMPEGSPPVIFANAISGFLSLLHIPVSISFTFVTLAISAFALTSLDTIARVARLTFQELFSGVKILSNPYAAAVITLAAGAVLAGAGYKEIWSLFGSANQLLAALVFTAMIVYFKKTGKKYSMLYVPIVFMFLVTTAALILGIYDIYINFSGAGASISAVIRIIFSILMLILSFVLMISAARIFFIADIKKLKGIS
jgi:carbon starvation protein